MNLIFIPTKGVLEKETFSSVSHMFTSPCYSSGTMLSAGDAADSKADRLLFWEAGSKEDRAETLEKVQCASKGECRMGEEAKKQGYPKRNEVNLPKTFVYSHAHCSASYKAKI